MKRIIALILSLTLICGVFSFLPVIAATKEEIKEDITHILFDATGHTPIVIPVINKV